MTTLEHKNYGKTGSEFIIHHCTLHPYRLLASFIVTTTLSVVFKLHEANVTMLWALSIFFAVALFMRLFNKVTKEALLVLPSLGVQVQTQFWFGHRQTRFFDKSCVKGIVINEAITMQSVLCYLAILLSPNHTGKVEHVFPLFTHSWLRQKELIYMYREMEQINLEYCKSSVHLHTSTDPSPVPIRERDTTLALRKGDAAVTMKSRDTNMKMRNVEKIEEFSNGNNVAVLNSGEIITMLKSGDPTGASVGRQLRPRTGKGVTSNNKRKTQSSKSKS